jgi:hypothetical protein
LKQEKQLKQLNLEQDPPLTLGAEQKLNLLKHLSLQQLQLVSGFGSSYFNTSLRIIR